MNRISIVLPKLGKVSGVARQQLRCQFAMLHTFRGGPTALSAALRHHAPLGAGPTTPSPVSVAALFHSSSERGTRKVVVVTKQRNAPQGGEERSRGLRKVGLGPSGQSLGCALVEYPALKGMTSSVGHPSRTLMTYARKSVTSSPDHRALLAYEHATQIGSCMTSLTSHRGCRDPMTSSSLMTQPQRGVSQKPIPAEFRSILVYFHPDGKKLGHVWKWAVFYSAATMGMIFFAGMSQLFYLVVVVFGVGVIAFSHHTQRHLVIRMYHDPKRDIFSALVYKLPWEQISHEFSLKDKELAIEVEEDEMKLGLPDEQIPWMFMSKPGFVKNDIRERFMQRAVVKKGKN